MAVRDFNTLVDALPDAVVVIDDGGLVHHANAAAERLFGWSLADRVGTSALDLVHPDDLEVALLSLTSIVSKDVGTPIELRVKTATDWIIVELIGAPYSGDDVEGGIVLTLRDLTERRRWEVAGGDDSQFRALLQNGAALTALIGPDGVVRSVSAAVARQLGRDAETVIGSNLADLVHPEDHDALRGAFLQARAVREATADDRRVSCEVLMAHRLGHLIPFQLSIVDLVDDPAVEGFVVSGHDVTELHATRVELAHTAAHDSLTGLPNRAAVRAHLREVLEVDTEGRRLAVGFVDLDRFKPVNDLFGHEAGDELLVAVAGRLKNALRTGDLVGRFGGDEFVIVAAASTLGEALRMAERLEDTIAEPFDLTCGTVQVYASIGVALADESSTVESLLTEADAAMYSVKHGRRGTPQNTRRSVNERRALAEALPAAFERDEFVVHYQPISDLQASDTVGYEARVRWQHPERGLLLPGQFLDVVEELGHEHGRVEVVAHRVRRTGARTIPTTLTHTLSTSLHYGILSGGL